MKHLFLALLCWQSISLAVAQNYSFYNRKAVANPAFLGDMARIAGDGYLLAVSDMASPNFNLRTHLLRLDAAGDTVWHKMLSATGEDFEVRQVCEASNGALFVAGQRSTASQTATPFVARIEPSTGQLEWIRQSDDGYLDFVNDVVVMGDTLLVVGHTYRNDSASTDVLLMGFDAQGNHIFSETYGKVGVNEAGYSVFGFGGGYWLAGESANHSVLMKLDNNFQLVSSHTFNSGLFHDHLLGAYSFGQNIYAIGQARYPHGVAPTFVLRLDMTTAQLDTAMSFMTMNAKDVDFEQTTGKLFISGLADIESGEAGYKAVVIDLATMQIDESAAYPISNISHTGNAQGVWQNDHFALCGISNGDTVHLLSVGQTLNDTNFCTTADPALLDGGLTFTAGLDTLQQVSWSGAQTIAVSYSANTWAGEYECNPIPLTTSTTNINTSESSLRLYPQPTNGWLVAEISEATGNFNYELYSSNGLRLSAGQTTAGQSIDVRHLSTGLYFLVAELEGKRFVRKFIKH